MSRAPSRSGPIDGIPRLVYRLGPNPLRRLRVDVRSVSKPEPGSGHHTFVCDAEIRIAEGDRRTRLFETITVHHPRGWMGIAAGFVFDIDRRLYPTFEARADHVRNLVLAEFDQERIISVFLLGTGDSRYPAKTSS